MTRLRSAFGVSPSGGLRQRHGKAGSAVALVKNLEHVHIYG